MDILRGKCASGGIALGHIRVIDEGNKTIEKYIVNDKLNEQKRLNEAVEKTKEHLNTLYEKARNDTQSDEAEIFQIHIMMLEDDGLLGFCRELITNEGINAESAFCEACNKISETLKGTNDEYIMERNADIEDIKASVLLELSGKSQNTFLEDNTIIFARNLTPSQTMTLDKSKICAFVTEEGGRNSHAAILSRSMKIPLIVGAKGCTDKKYNDKSCIVDAENGEVFIEPDEAKTNDYLIKKEKKTERIKSLESIKGKKTVTKDGKKIRLYANIGSTEELSKALENDAEGIGLFRSEFLYIGKKEVPSEEEQFLTYKTVLEKMNGREVIIRTLDIGADKKAECLNLSYEENPVLGYRAIRICLDDKALFKTQLRALLRASIYGRLLIMFPMITSEKEVISAIDIIDDVERELKKENIPFDKNIKIGAMIETPAAAIVSDKIAPLVDFFSIGTNDLTQYTLACDRENEKVAHIYNQKHEAVIKLIKMTCKSAKEAGIWVGVCGEMASDEEAVPMLLEMGIEELSVSPPYVLPIRECILNAK